ncbi:MAG TPA: endonuclease/exonuclease/phosphatase family protein [Pirellulales bacterium]
MWNVSLVDRGWPRRSGAETKAPWAARRLAGRPRGVAVVAWGYALLMLVVSLTIWRVGDRWWPTTLLLYGPRWIWGIPLAALMLQLPRLGKRLIGPLVLGGACWMVPIMGACVPWRAWQVDSSPEVQLRVLTCNVAIDAVRDGALSGLIEKVQPDVVALQEAPADAEARWFSTGLWYFERAGRVLVASRFPIEQASSAHWRDIGAEGSLLRCDVNIDGDLCHVFGIHLMTPREGLEAVLSHGWRSRPTLENNTHLRGLQSAGARRLVERVSGPVIVAGDFNLPVDSLIYRKNWGAWVNAFSTCGWGLGHTKQTRWFGARIDHVLANDDWRFTRCWVGPDVGSDHLPLIADVYLRRQAVPPAVAQTVRQRAAR